MLHHIPKHDHRKYCHPSVSCLRWSARNDPAVQFAGAPDGYKTQVPAGWLSLIVNAGDGIDMDMFLSRQPKETIIQKVGQQLRINRSKIKDASDTNTDFDDIDGAIRSGYFLKEGLANNEDFYYLNLLITITASNEEDLEWKVSEMKKLLLSQDMNACTCHFREEQAFLSALPLVAMEKKLYERGKRNLLTGGAASCYPFTSYEMCDDNGILLGVNKYNSSLIIVDIFNSAVYKNANMSILGTSGAGKTFTMQLMALRMRLAYMNKEAFDTTINLGKMTYWSRSRDELWTKGLTSGHFQYVKSLTADCDFDTILAKVSQVGAACHTGNRTCFFNSIVQKEYVEKNPLKVLESVYDIIKERKAHPQDGSYTNYLFGKGTDKILQKLGERVYGNCNCKRNRAIL